ncbi:MAG: ATP-binding response regulator [Methyloligellaceae bacterium]
MKRKDNGRLSWSIEHGPSKPILFTTDDGAEGETCSREVLLERRLKRLEKINGALMRRVERSMDHHANAYSLFQAAIVLEDEVRARTTQLSKALFDLETTNRVVSQAKEAAERSNATKTRFLAAASHDLLQPLNAARLCMSALKDEDVQESPAQLITQIDRSLTTVEQLLRALLDISKLDAGVTQPEIRSFAIDDILRSIHSDFAPDATRRDLKLRVLSDPAVVRSDPIFLRRILQNLLSNAIRYTQSGGVLVACRRDGGVLHIAVCDTGMGIEDDDRDEIFDEFHRGHAPPGGPSDGLGLGLAIVKRMARALGHPLDLRSRPGKGTVFSVTVPLGARLSSAREPRLERRDFVLAHEGAFVVIVENDSAVREAMEALLARWSCKTISAVSVPETLDVLKDVERVPDLIIADYHLGGGETGLQAIESVRAHFASVTPGLIVTADHTSKVAELAQYAKCELLTKPVQPAELRALMSHLLTAGDR